MDSYHILLVDDDREIVKSLGKLLELEGYRVYKAYDGMEALDCLMTEEIHLILLDVMMPKLNGLSALMKIREKNNIPIIILSAKTEESDKVLGLSMGADDYVTKPYNTQELMARVKSQSGKNPGGRQPVKKRRADPGSEYQGADCRRPAGAADSHRI